MYTTSRFDEKVAQYDLQARIAELLEALETTQEIHAVRALFEPFPPYWKRRAGRLRLIARIVHVGEDQVLCLLDILERRDASYEQFMRDPRRFGERSLDPLLSEHALQFWLKARKALKDKKEYQRLPDQLRPWLEPPGWGTDTDSKDWVIYESEEWIKRFRRREINDFWQTYYTIVRNIVERTRRAQTATAWRGVKLASEESRSVLFSDIETTDTPTRRVLLLLAPFDHQPSEEEIAQVIRVTHPVYASHETSAMATQQLSLDRIVPFASRAYPDYMLGDDKSWLAIEREEEANLALSPEEEQLLKSVSIPVSGSNLLPAFINGRAGSGKSTMLFYLFADYCYRKWRQDLPGDPLFLTYNERLLKVAKDGVRKILSSHHRFLAERRKEDEIPPSDAFFQPFQDFLLGWLPHDERERFNPEHYLSFHRFKQLYLGEPFRIPLPRDPQERERLQKERKLALRPGQAKEWSPELCWHVIRVFIKGYRHDDYMDPDDYQEVPRRERTISEEAFKEIYETIWTSWYRPITTEQGYWDDQDLIRKILELKCYHPQYTAVFCDEAQDFTRLELQLVMRLSVLSQYDLGYQAIQSLPFAFAGDPFQTLNPTGFRWSSAQAAFYGEVIAALDPAKQWNLGINFQELTYNYRSTPPIVRAINLIQLWRHVLFDLPELQPQMWWQKGEFPNPQKFILGQNIPADELRRHLERTIIIVPCEEGQEVSYIQQDSILSQILPQATMQEPPRNVLSAITAKGLEFKRIILYKFGEACDETVWKLVSEHRDHPVEFEYFFNKLYVAASRAMERLFVVDSEEGDRRLWKYASRSQEFDPFLSRVKNRAGWEDRLGTIPLGAPGSEWEMHEDDPRSIAEEFRKKGGELRNPNLLRRAKQYYDLIGDRVEEDLCEAWALRFEERFREAGNLFLKHVKVDEAWECFWEGMCWPELETWYDKYGIEGVRAIARDVAVFVLKRPRDVEAIKTFTYVLENGIGNNRLGDPLTKQWRAVVKEYVRRISILTEQVLKQDEWQQLGVVLEALEKAGYQGVLDWAGKCFYRAANYERAVICWERCGATETREYYWAKAEVIGFPKGLEWLERAHADDRIIEKWEQAGGLNEATDPRWLQVVGPVLERKERYQEAFRVYLQLGDIAKVKECFEKASRNMPTSDLWEGLVSLVAHFMRRGHWLEVLDAIDVYFPGVVGHDTEKVALQYEVVRELAYSNLTPESLTTADRQRYENFVNPLLITSDWQQHLSMKEGGAALERIGGFISTLRFYERFISDPDPEQQEFARERWIATKRKHEEYFRQQPSSDRADQIKLELANQAHDWGIPADIRLPPYPPLEARGVKGLPAGTKVEQLSDGNLRIQIHHIEVRTSRNARSVLITDTSTLKALRVDLAQGQVSGPEEVEIHYESEDGRLSFEVPASGYQGLVFYGGEKPRLELKIRGVPGTIFFEL